MAMPGGRMNHQAIRLMARSKAKLSIMPQLMAMGSPKPRKARDDSAMMAVEMSSTAWAMMSGST